MNLNELQKTFTDNGQKVADLRAEMQAMAVNDDVTVEQIEEKKAEVANAVAKRDLAKENLDAATAEMAKEVVDTKAQPLTKSEANQKASFVNDFKKMVTGDKSFMNSVNSTIDENGTNVGLTIPQDIQTTINTLKRQYESLEELVRVEKVGTLSGSRVYEKWSDVTPLQNLDADDAEIGEIDSPKLTLIKYLIKRYAGIQTVTNTLLKDTAENILAWLTSWVAKKVVVTRNQAIISQLDKAPKKATIAKFDDVKDLMGKLDPAIHMTSYFVTNQSGWVALSKVKTGTGKYLLEPDPTQPDHYTVLGHELKIVSDRWLPDVSGNHPLYFGDFSQAITLFDRENMSIATTNVGGNAFTTDTTKLRVIDRFDVQPTDSDAYLVASFSEVADQVFNLPTSATK
ncbi:Predicted phage phi-C31 gp36 major capsid-like protein (gp36) [Fructobacillus fructosus]|uniref:Predicted phage phi-C31 gp36 major capsid-like protein (Gp36) n=1 Tax=Fructobacillus fructosus TaxID=1631 RepID=A0ABM9MLV5_9LACO|nr:Predicted phage phi-C31 gp36 major capsid-like protein (gp36) [Fructobacillus fructosus]